MAKRSDAGSRNIKNGNPLELTTQASLEPNEEPHHQNKNLWRSLSLFVLALFVMSAMRSWEGEEITDHRHDDMTRTKKEKRRPSTQERKKENDVRSVPPVNEVLEGEKVIGDVSSLLDFAIMDFPKCGTTFLMSYIHKAQDAYLNQAELCSLDRNRPFRIVQEYYNLSRITSDGRPIQIGLKCPRELETEFALSNYAKYFFRTKFIVTTRHPISWFQSYYNFRVYHGYPIPMPPTKQLIGPCQPHYPYVPLCNRHCPMQNMNVCTNRANFHHALSRLGKTPMDTPEELHLLGYHNMTTFHNQLQGKIFLMDMQQIRVEHPASKTLAEDLSSFLGLTSQLPPLRPYKTPPDKYSNKQAAEGLIDICDDEHAPVRKVLLENGRNAAKWISTYFLQSPDVIVSSKDQYLKIIRRWSLDPCDHDNKTKNKAKQNNDRNKHTTD